MKKFTIYQAFVILFFSLTVFESNTLHGQESVSSINLPAIIDNELDSLILANLAAINPDSIKNTMLQLQNMGTRFMLAPDRKQVALWLQDRFESVGCQTTAIDSFQTHTTITVNNIYYDTVTWQYNVSASLPGHLNPDKIVLIGGHYDCYTSNDPMILAPGADDNASSVAAIIELARVINNSGYAHNKTIRFLALGAEELMYFSSISGARDYANKCAAMGEDVVMYINNDMIAHEPSASDWIVDYLVHDAGFWGTALTVNLSGQYTSLTPNVQVQGNFGADDLPFWQVGYQTGYFFEHNFCPYYHTENDIVDNCNIAYCTEVARLNMALLLSVTEVPAPLASFFLYATGDGQSLQAIWKPPYEEDIVGYTINFGSDPGNLQETYTTTDTLLTFSGLDPDTVYYASISAVNSRGNLSIPVFKNARPASVTLDQGILVVAGSQGGLMDPPQEDIDQYYDGLLSDFTHELYDATTAEELLLEQIGSYSSILWHIEDPNCSSTLLSDYQEVLRNYLWLGGHLMFTGYRPARIFGVPEYPAVFREGDFVYDWLKIQTSHNEAARLFSGANPDDPSWPQVFVDSVKMPVFNYHLPWVEVFTLADDGKVIYRYDTNYDTTTTQGAYYNKPVGICPSGSQQQTFTLGFPLYYMDSQESGQLVYRVMAQLFGEVSLAVNDRHEGTSPLVWVYPNPATSKVTFTFNREGYGISEVRIVDVSGREVNRFNTDHSGSLEWDTHHLPAGLYFYNAISGDIVESGKIILVK